MQKLILVSLLISASFTIYANDTKLKAYDCRAHIPITPEDSKFIEALDMVNRFDPLELVEEKIDGIIIAGFSTNKKSAIDRSTKWIRRKFGFKFKGKLINCEQFELDELWWKEH